MNLDERLVDRQRLEGAKMEASREHAEFVAKAHETLEGLMNLAPAAKPTPFNYRGKPQEIAELEAQIFKAANLAWALRTFPVFDPSCLRMMRKEKGLKVQCPAIPGAILKNLEKVSGRFERTEIIWEAQWSAYAEVKDPLIIGTIGMTSFLIDQFDATKLERYVMGEFCRKPVAE
jgi:hypothetical protein